MAEPPVASHHEGGTDIDIDRDGDAFLDMSALAPVHELAPLKCCCGSAECVFLRHNSSVLDTVEKDVTTAARMGKALLARHEAYMADAERDRLELTSRIEQLEMDNKELEQRNARTIEENRNLLDQLETLNTTVSDSEGRIKSLEATLLSSQQIIRRLEGETARAESLERQLAFLEQEQEQLQNTLASTHEEARSSMSRWQRAERGIIDLHEQLERMEKEAREEREKHAEMIGRMEKQREVEKELNTAAGRLKGAAAAKTLNYGKNGSNVVSHFVRDLLQDNTNLQQGIIELREMLMNSNDEIQALRDQLLYHQPVTVGDDDVSAGSTLRAELAAKESPERQTPVVSQELHIHHHYHVAAKTDAKKPKKKRQVLSPGVFTPPALRSVPSTPPSTSWRPPTTNRTPRDSLMSNNRLSIMSEQPSDFAPSSVPSSPQSDPRNSVFDPIGVDSWPASPTTSVDPMSPAWRAHRKYPSNMSARSFQLPAAFSLDQTTPSQTHTIIEEGDGVEDLPDLGLATDGSAADDETSSKDHGTVHEEVEIYVDTDDDGAPRRRIRRALSHESIISLTGGLGIHTLKSRPSQLTLSHLSNATSITASSTVTARPVLSRDSAKRSSLMLRESYGSSPIGSLRSVSGPAPASPQPGSLKLSSWVGWRPWKGGAASGASTPVAARESQYQKDYGRPPGINQPGSIPGFHAYMAAHQKRSQGKVMPDQVDRDALREGLAE
ncbi:uncharacterized protein JN550_002716 [Neoarthrinium moseri]|uniref:uncharacterized protein n=1 Tax=Neoarthrinium moseri TaxID=1658444 RepID=UPI001FDADBC0|nr:uncharacterized protein JN550_002716 [Neoarthrinium moseri]KAI1874137.1 hypothetical protein JN550_002716 [Neoarthrinium moseri]